MSTLDLGGDDSPLTPDELAKLKAKPDVEPEPPDNPENVGASK